MQHIPVSSSLHHRWLVVLLALSRLLPVVSPVQQSDQSAKPQTDSGKLVGLTVVQQVLLWSRPVASPSTSKERAEQLGVHVVDHRVVRKSELEVCQLAEAFTQGGHGGELLNGFS